MRRRRLPDQISNPSQDPERLRPPAKACAVDQGRVGPWPEPRFFSRWRAKRLRQAGELSSRACPLEEARRNLPAGFPAATEVWSGLLAQLHIVPRPAAPRLAFDLPEKDQPIWAAAGAARATHLLTGDLKDFCPLTNRPADTGGVVIQPVAEFLPAFGNG